MEFKSNGQTTGVGAAGSCLVLRLCLRRVARTVSSAYSTGELEGPLHQWCFQNFAPVQAPGGYTQSGTLGYGFKTGPQHRGQIPYDCGGVVLWFILLAYSCFVAQVRLRTRHRFTQLPFSHSITHASPPIVVLHLPILP